MLGGLLADRRLRVYADGRIEGVATLEPDVQRAPRRPSEPSDSVVAGGALRNGRDGEGARDAVSDAGLRSPAWAGGRASGDRRRQRVLSRGRWRRTRCVSSRRQLLGREHDLSLIHI